MKNMSAQLLQMVEFARHHPNLSVVEETITLDKDQEGEITHPAFRVVQVKRHRAILNRDPAVKSNDDKILFLNQTGQLEFFTLGNAELFDGLWNPGAPEPSADETLQRFKELWEPEQLEPYVKPEHQPLLDAMVAHARTLPNLTVVAESCEFTKIDGAKITFPSYRLCRTGPDHPNRDVTVKADVDIRLFLDEDGELNWFSCGVGSWFDSLRESKTPPTPELAVQALVGLLDANLLAAA